MGNLKSLFNLLDGAFMAIWGLTILDVVPLLKMNFFDNLDSVIKTLMAFAGLVYFGITIPYKIKNYNLDLKIKREELEKIQHENDENNKE